MYNVGDRVGAMMSQENGVIEFLGYGVYAGSEIPPENIGGFNFGFTNPKIKLDNGDVVWGCECWWGDEARFKELCDVAEVHIVSIADYRKIAGEVETVTNFSNLNGVSKN